jgi:hypothetical protein
MGTQYQKNWKLIFGVSGWIIATIGFAGFAAANLKLPSLFRLLTGGVETGGVITDKIRENHQRIRYSFTVDGHTYTWGGFSGDIEKTFDQVNVGDPVSITYEKDNPTNSCLGDPRNTFYPNLRMAIFMSLIPTIAIALFGVVSVVKSGLEEKSLSDP